MGLPTQFTSEEEILQFLEAPAESTKFTSEQDILDFLDQPAKVLPQTELTPEITSKSIQEALKVPVIPPVGPFGGITAQQILKIVEPILATLDLGREYIRRNIKSSALLFKKMIASEVDILGRPTGKGEITEEDIKQIVGRPRDFAGMLKLIVTPGSVFGELSAGKEVSGDDMLQFLPQIFEEIGIPRGPTILKLPYIGEVSTRGFVGFLLEMASLRPDTITKSLVKRGINILKKSSKVTTEEISEFKNMINIIEGNLKEVEKTGVLPEEAIKRAEKVGRKTREQLTKESLEKTGIPLEPKPKDAEFQQKLSEAIEEVKEPSDLNPTEELARKQVVFRVEQLDVHGNKVYDTYNDPVTENFIIVRPGESIADKLKDIRQRFANTPLTTKQQESANNIISRTAGFVGKEEASQIVKGLDIENNIIKGINRNIPDIEGHGGSRERAIEKAIKAIENEGIIVDRNIIPIPVRTTQEPLLVRPELKKRNLSIAVKMKDGKVIEDKTVATHLELVEKHGLNFDDVDDTGFMKAGKYVDRDNIQTQILKESIETKKTFADSSKSPERAGAEIPKTNPEIRRKQRMLFGLMKSKDISKDDLELALKNGYGINDLKFTSEDAITNSQLDEVIKRIRKVDRNWLPEEKTYYLMNGIEPPGPGGTGGLVMLAEEGPFSNRILRNLRGFQIGVYQTLETTFRKLGPIGNEIAERTLNAQQEAASMFMQMRRPVKDNLKKLSNSELKLFVNSYEKPETIAKLPRKILDSRNVFDNATAQFSNMAKKRLIKTITKSGKKVPFKERKNYFMHVFAPNYLAPGKGRERIIRSIMKKKKITRGEAREELNEILRFYRKHKSDPNLEYERIFDAPGWVGDPTQKPQFGSYKKDILYAVDKYFASASRRLAEAKWFDEGGITEFGKDWKTLKQLIRSEPDNDTAQFFYKAVDRVRGVDNQLIFEHDVLRILKNYQVINKLGLAWFPNAFQPSITTLPRVQQLGFFRSMQVMGQGFKDTLSKGGRRFAEDVGSITEQQIRDVIGLTSKGISGKAATVFMRYITPFEKLENFNNILSANVGNRYFKVATEIVAGKIEPLWWQKIGGKRSIGNRHYRNAIRELEVLGLSKEKINALKRGNLNIITEEDISKASWRIARETQFRATPLDLPLYASSPYGRVFYQFKTFSINIAKLGWQRMVKPVAKFVKTGGQEGALLPLATFLGVSGLVTGELHGWFRSAISGRERPSYDDEALKRISDNIWWASSFGMFSDMYTAIMTGRGLETIAGPTFGGTLKESFDFLRQIPKSIDNEEFIELLGRTAVEQTPIVGQLPQVKEKLFEE